MEPTKHSLLSPSAAHRWIHCMPSARLEASEPDTTGPYAEEGTLAHAICAMKLLSALGRDTSQQEEEIERLSPGYYDGEMEECCQGYADMVLSIVETARGITPDARVAVEQRVDASAYAPDCVGTTDALVVADGQMWVIDFKYGQGHRVAVERNAQLSIYALAALDLYGDDFAVERVRLVIAQPRLGGTSSWETTADDLRQWGRQTLAPAAALAHEGKGKQKAGWWCRFCKVSGCCVANADAFDDLIPEDLLNAQPELMTDEELAELYPAMAKLKEWATGVEDYARKKALGGTRLNGLKIVDAGRSVRTITDPQAVASALITDGYEEDEIFKPQEMKPLTALEKAVGRKHFSNLCGQWISKQPRKFSPALVPEDDPRDGLSPDDIAGRLAAESFRDIDKDNDKDSTNK